MLNDVSFFNASAWAVAMTKDVRLSQDEFEWLQSDECQPLILGSTGGKVSNFESPEAGQDLLILSISMACR